MRAALGANGFIIFPLRRVVKGRFALRFDNTMWHGRIGGPDAAGVAQSPPYRNVGRGNRLAPAVKPQRRFKARSLPQCVLHSRVAMGAMATRGCHGDACVAMHAHDKREHGALRNLQPPPLRPMRNLLRFSLACWSCLAPFGLAGATAPETPPAPVASENAISVYLASGRTFTAALDARTDPVQLWLRFEQAGATLLRPIRWDRVIWAEVAGEKLSGRQLRRLIEQLRQEIPAQPVLPSARTNIVMIGASEVGHASEKGTVPICAKHPPGRSGGHRPKVGRGLSPFPPSADTSRVVSLAIDAGVANWDENVEADGLLVHVYPLGTDGALVPVHGTLEVDLKAEQNGSNRLHQPFVDAGHWSQQVRPADFGPMGAVYRLRFQSIHPEFEHWLESRGAVHACLTVPGQGTYEATAAMVRIRPYSTVRNHLQQTTGHRFFPDERTGDGRH